MLEFLSRLARRIRPAAPLLAVLAGLLFSAIVVLILTTGSAAADRWLTAGVAALLWTLCGWVFIQAFATVPPPPEPGLRGLRKLQRQLNRAFHRLLALALVGLVLASLLLTKRLLTG
jgi:hypothetical protein